MEPNYRGIIMRILISDDEEVSRKKMTKILSGFGDCKIVDRGESTLVVFKKAFKSKKPFDLILLDIHMPDLNGIKVLCKIREFETEMSIEKNNRVKIIMVTANKKREVIKNCIKNGCNDYIAKPFNKDIIIQKLVNLGLIKSSGEFSQKA